MLCMVENRRFMVTMLMDTTLNPKLFSSSMDVIGTVVQLIFLTEILESDTTEWLWNNCIDRQLRRHRRWNAMDIK